MDLTTLLWILGIQTTVIIGLAVGFFNHVKECRDVRASIAEIKVIAESVRIELGGRETGIRGQLYEQQKLLIKLASKVPGGLEVFD